MERKNRDLKTQLAIAVGRNHRNWVEKLSAIRFAMNTAVFQSIGYSAAYLTFGRELRTLDDVQHDIREVVQSENFVAEITPYLKQMAATFYDVRDKVEKLQDSNSKLNNAQRREVPDLEIGTQVLVTTHVPSNSGKGVTSKFMPKRDGPYIITQKKGSTTYEIACKDDVHTPLGTFHISDLTVYNGDMDVTPVQKIRKRGRPKKT